MSISIDTKDESIPSIDSENAKFFSFKFFSTSKILTSHCCSAKFAINAKTKRKERTRAMLRVTSSVAYTVYHIVDISRKVEGKDFKSKDISANNDLYSYTL